MNEVIFSYLTLLLVDCFGEADFVPCLLLSDDASSLGDLESGAAGEEDLLLPVSLSRLLSTDLAPAPSLVFS